MASTRIQFHRAKGTHYEFGYAVGCMTQEAIQRRIAAELADLSVLFAFVEKDNGLQLYQHFVEITRLLYPWYWDEIRGLANGSEIPLEKIVVLNFLNEVSTAYLSMGKESSTNLTTEKQANETGEKGCTTVSMNRKDTNTFALLHNEDHFATLYSTGFFIEADIQSSEYNDGKRRSPDEKFFGYCYAGTIPCNY